ncbi:MAG: sensor histidine kinase [Pseudomonadaceae bacterium]|nr:MAG: sensor histidine kinase [Pseudomonadaceae bacterium]
MRLYEFISANMETILKEWEDFARANQPSEANLKSRELRDHARAMLENIARDLSSGHATPDHTLDSATSRDCDSAAEVHADERLDAGFSISLLIAEYRSLRASVLRLWFADEAAFSPENAADIIRFNEAIDHTLTESVTRYSDSVLENSDLFVGMLGHDLRSPLQVIEFGADKLKKMEDAHGKANNKMGPVMSSSVQRMKMMLDNLMDFTETRMGKGVKIKVSHTDLADISKGLVDEFRSAHDEYRFKHHASGDCTGNWDATRVGQICQNLIGNALQHGSEQGEIAVICEGSDDCVVLSVKNDGKPIPEADQQVIFELANRKHYQEGNPNKNMGLGLYIVRELVTAHNGHISVESAPDTGTVFRVELPKAQTDTSAA